MNDRELLEMAAKAAGLMILRWDTSGAAVIKYETPFTKVAGWNPLTNDGDALRLAAKLRLVIQHAPKYVVVMDVDRNIAEHQDTRENDGDPYRATRRAIVCAAAEIGRSMP